MKNKLLLLLMFCSIVCFAQSSKWLRDAKFGVFVHYLYTLQNTKTPWNNGLTTSWDDCVNDFDTEKFANQVSSLGAKYVIFTIQQGDRYFCLPNTYYENLTGFARGSATSHRDLINDLYVSLNKRGIKLMLYATGDGVLKDGEAAQKLNNPILNLKQNDGKFMVNEQWVNTWSSILQSISKQYGKKISGWWFDGTYPFIGYNEKYLNILKKAVKSGNPNAIVAFNKSPQKEIEYYSNIDDYTAGESDVITTLPPANGKIKGKQWHLLTYVGNYWAQPGFRFDQSQFSDFLKNVRNRKGAVTLDVFVNRKGEFNPQQYEILKNIVKK